MFFKYLMTINLLMVFFGGLFAQFPGPAGTPGSTAIHMDSSIFIAWAETCTLDLGSSNISDPDAAIVNTGTAEFALGQADGISVVSLGDGGSATLTFSEAIIDGPGFDFAVFENGFTEGFYELAFVEVSSDGDYFVRFDAVSLTADSTQVGPFDAIIQSEHLHNLAGKYVGGFGTPFDLSDLPEDDMLDKNSISHVRIIDVVGSIDPEYASYDSEGNIINDPFPTAFASGGFDLDGVGVINRLVSTDNISSSSVAVSMFPNPVSEYITLLIPDAAKHFVEEIHYDIMGTDGKILSSGFYAEGRHIDISALKEGVYYLSLHSERLNFNSLRFVKI